MLGLCTCFSLSLERTSLRLSRPSDQLQLPFPEACSDHHHLPAAVTLPPVSQLLSQHLKWSQCPALLLPASSLRERPCWLKCGSVPAPRVLQAPGTHLLNKTDKQLDDRQALPTSPASSVHVSHAGWLSPCRGHPVPSSPVAWHWLCIPPHPNALPSCSFSSSDVHSVSPPQRSRLHLSHLLSPSSFLPLH